MALHMDTKFKVEILMKREWSDTLSVMSLSVSFICCMVLLSIFLTGCDDDAWVVDRNMTKAADNFEVNRRIVFYNGITDKYILTIEGRCSLTDSNRQLEVIVKTSENTYKKHFLGLSDNVTYFAEQLDDIELSEYHYRVTFKPEVIIPDIRRE